MDSIVAFTPPAGRVPTTAHHSLRRVTALRSAASTLARSNARPRFWRSGDGLVLPYGPPATSWTPSCRQFASFHAAKAAHRELLTCFKRTCSRRPRQLTMTHSPCSQKCTPCRYRTLPNAPDVIAKTCWVRPLGVLSRRRWTSGAPAGSGRRMRSPVHRFRPRLHPQRTRRVGWQHELPPRCASFTGNWSSRTYSVNRDPAFTPSSGIRRGI